MINLFKCRNLRKCILAAILSCANEFVEVMLNASSSHFSLAESSPEFSGPDDDDEHMTATIHGERVTFNRKSVIREENGTLHRTQIYETEQFL